MTQFDIVQFGFFVTLAKAAMSVLMFSTITFLLLRIANKLSHVDFKESLGIIQGNPTALSTYLSVRYAVLGLGNALIIAANFMYS